MINWKLLVKLDKNGVSRGRNIQRSIAFMIVRSKPLQHCCNSVATSLQSGFEDDIYYKHQEREGHDKDQLTFQESIKIKTSGDIVKEGKESERKSICPQKK